MSPSKETNNFFCKITILFPYYSKPLNIWEGKRTKSNNNDKFPLTREEVVSDVRLNETVGSSSRAIDRSYGTSESTWVLTVRATAVIIEHTLLRYLHYVTVANRTCAAVSSSCCTLLFMFCLGRRGHRPFTSHNSLQNFV